ncbi:MAG: ATPase [Gammaproteobacteria bacterium GWE2_42_36]|nr:MAG: ATPase [Gammaproteobacteria bacterium GWE2_42_36]
MFDRLLTLPFKGKKSFFLLGPRGTGKTTWIKNRLPNALYLDLLDYSLYRSLLSNPQHLEALIPPQYKQWIIIDEIQKIPALLNEVHRLIEHKQHKFILTGSSARSLRKKGVNLLAGRALSYHMHPLIATELGDQFNLKKLLQYGALPSVFSEQNPKKFLESYIQTYLKEEVLQEGLTRNLSDFAHFLEIASFSQGSLINMNAIARESGIHQKVVINYFTILDDLLIGYRLPPFKKRAKRRLITHEKFYYFDVGIYRCLRPTGPLDSPEEVGGIALESLFLQHLRAINDYLQLGFQLFFWRTSTGHEVDFIAYGEKGLLAFEIKRAKTIDSKSLKGLKAFQQDYPMAKLFLIYGGDHEEYHSAVRAIPFEKALLELPTLLT